MPPREVTKGGMLPVEMPRTAAAGVHALQPDTATVHVRPEPTQGSPEVPASGPIRTVLPAQAVPEVIIREGPDPQVQETSTAGQEGLTGVPVLPGHTDPLHGPLEA